MSIETLLESCPDYAKDLKLNLGTLLRQPDLTEQQVWGSAVAAAMAGRNARSSEPCWRMPAPTSVSRRSSRPKRRRQ
jgi:hypothetical protein